MIDLSANIALVHLVFHISLLKKCLVDPTSVMSLESVGFKDRLPYNDIPVDILDIQVYRMKNKEFS